MSQELVKVEGGVVAVASEWRVVDLVARRDKVQAVVAKLMKPGLHFGKIPGCPKDTLFKPGAEMLLMTFRLSVRPIEIKDMSEPGIIRYQVTLGAYSPDGGLAGTGIGEASSGEDKYAWRRAICKEEFDATPADQKRTKYQKGMGGKVYTVDQIRTNPADIANTVLKMGKKRALIDLTLTTLGVSDIFSQDIEDIPAELVASVIEAEATPEAAVSLDKVMAGKVQAEPAPKPRPTPPPAPKPEPDGRKHLEAVIQGRCKNCGTEDVIIGAETHICASCKIDQANENQEAEAAAENERSGAISAQDIPSYAPAENKAGISAKPPKMWGSSDDDRSKVEYTWGNCQTCGRTDYVYDGGCYRCRHPKQKPRGK